MLLRLLTAACVFGFGYYLGKEVGRTEPIREDLAKARKERETDVPLEETKDDDPVT